MVLPARKEEGERDYREIERLIGREGDFGLSLFAAGEKRGGRERGVAARVFVQVKL